MGKLAISISVVLVALAVPLWILNSLGGIVAFFWLVFAGEWGLIGWGILGLLVSAFGLSIVMAPSMLFAIPAMKAIQSGKKTLGWILGLLASLYTNAVIVAWCVAVLIFVTRKAGDETSWVPLLLWANAIATGPLAYMSSKERNNQSVTTTQFAQLGYAISIVGILFVDFSLMDVIVTFVVAMFVSTLVGLVLLAAERDVSVVNNN